MKKITSIAVLFVLLSSCEKSIIATRHCWECTVTATTSMGGSGSSKTTLCNRTESEIKAYERDNTTTTKATSQGVTVTTTTTARCSKK